MFLTAQRFEATEGLRLGLYERFERDPEGVLAALHARAIQEMDADQLFALAEYSFVHASRTRERPYFVAASIYAYAYLFPEDGAPAPDAFDPRLRTAVDLYNRSIAAALITDARELALREGTFPFHLGTLELRIDPRGFEWADQRLANFVPAAELEVRGLRNRYRRAGIETLGTAGCGGIRIRTDAAGAFEMTTARIARQAIWRWPAAPGCP